MTVQATTTATKSPATKSPAPRVDALLKLAQEDIPREQARLRALAKTDITPERLLSEMNGTVVDLLKDVARGLVEVRDWAYSYMNQISEHLEANDERLDVMEQFGGDSTLIPDDAEVLSNVCDAAKYLATSMLQGPFPIEERDEEGKQKLAELIALCDQGKQIVSDAVLVMDDDDEDGDDDDDDSDDDVSEAN